MNNKKDNYNFKDSEALLKACACIDYNPENGEIKRIDRKNGNGSYDHYGYLIIKIKGIQYKAHRLAWAKHYGTAPTGIIDHINRDKKDNRIANLRDTSQEVNVLNKVFKVNEKTGVRGVYCDEVTKGLKKKYSTRIKNKTYRFYTIEEVVKFRSLFNF
jgi:hypothetical protein